MKSFNRVMYFAVLLCCIISVNLLNITIGISSEVVSNTDYSGTCIISNGSDKISGGFYTYYNEKLYIVTSAHSFHDLAYKTAYVQFEDFDVYLFGKNKSYLLKIAGKDLSLPNIDKSSKYTFITPLSKHNNGDKIIFNTLDIAAISINKPSEVEIKEIKRSFEKKAKDNSKGVKLTKSNVFSLLSPLEVYIPKNYDKIVKKDAVDLAYKLLANEFSITRTDRYSKKTSFSAPEFNWLASDKYFMYSVVDVSKGGIGWVDIPGNKICFTECENISGYEDRIRECLPLDEVGVLGSINDYIFGICAKSISGMSGLPLTISSTKDDKKEVIGIIQGGFNDSADNTANSWSVPLLPLLTTIDCLEFIESDPKSKAAVNALSTSILSLSNKSPVNYLDYLRALSSIKTFQTLNSKSVVPIEWGGGTVSLDELNSVLQLMISEAQATRKNVDIRSSELMRSINGMEFNISDFNIDESPALELDNIAVLQNNKEIMSNKISENIVCLYDFVNADIFSELKNQPKNSKDDCFSLKLSRIETIKTAWAYLSKANPVINSTINFDDENLVILKENGENINHKNILSLIKFRRLKLSNNNTEFTIYVPHYDQNINNDKIITNQTSITYSGVSQLSMSPEINSVNSDDNTSYAVVKMLTVYRGDNPSETINYFVSCNNNGYEQELAKEYFYNKVALPKSSGYIWDESDKYHISFPYTYLPGDNSKYAMMRVKGATRFTGNYVLLAINSILEKYKGSPSISKNIGHIYFPGAMIGVSGYSSMPSIKAIDNIDSVKNVKKLICWLEWYFSIVLTITAN